MPAHAATTLDPDVREAWPCRQMGPRLPLPLSALALGSLLHRKGPHTH